MPRPVLSATPPVVDISEHPWDATPPSLPPADTTPPALVVETLALWDTLSDASRPRVERGSHLSLMACTTCSAGGFGLPPDRPDRALFTREVVAYLDQLWPKVDARLGPPGWVVIRKREFEMLAPEIQRAWLVHLRVPELPAHLRDGGALVLVGHPMGEWRLITLWAGDPGPGRLAALDLVRVLRTELLPAELRGRTIPSPASPSAPPGEDRTLEPPPAPAEQ